MKTKLTLLMATLALTAVAAQADERKVAVEDLPQPVQETLRSRADSPVKNVVQRTVDGRVVYFVEIERNNAPNPRLRIAEDGTLLGDFDPLRTPMAGGLATAPMAYPGVVETVPMAPRVALTDLPKVVSEAATREAAGRDIVDIDRETWRGKPVYEIEFRERGLNSRVYLDETGAVVRDERRPTNPLKSFFLGTQLEDTPAAVQETVRRVAGDREIADVDRENLDGQTIYRVEIGERENRREVHVAEDGKILFDSRAPDRVPRG